MKNWAQHEIGDIATIDSNKILISGVKTFCSRVGAGREAVS